ESCVFLAVDPPEIAPLDPDTPALLGKLISVGSIEYKLVILLIMVFDHFSNCISLAEGVMLINLTSSADTTGICHEALVPVTEFCHSRLNASSMVCDWLASIALIFYTPLVVPPCVKKRSLNASMFV